MSEAERSINVDVVDGPGCGHSLHLKGFSQEQLLLSDDATDGQGQLSQVEVVAASPIAAQNACPNGSFAQAMQLFGSPEHVAEGAAGEGEGAVSENTGLKFDGNTRRRRGTGG